MYLHMDVGIHTVNTLYNKGKTVQQSDASRVTIRVWYYENLFVFVG